MKNLTIMEKIALTWTFPLAIAAAFGFVIIASIIHVTRLIFVHSGTAGAAIFIIQEIKFGFKKNQWQRIKKRDQQIAQIDELLKSK